MSSLPHSPQPLYGNPDADSTSNSAKFKFPDDSVIPNDFDLFKDAPHFKIESHLSSLDKSAVAGVDEAGRGPLAGPVVAACVLLDPDNIPIGLNDSKKLTEKKRNALFDEIIMHSQAIAFASVSSRRIDEINILQATLEAMTRAVNGLSIIPAHILFDGRDVPQAFKKSKAQRGYAVIKGDTISLSIAAASIVAKVIRDRMMINTSRFYPEYGFSGHKGYGAKKHLDAIKEHGPCTLHRMSFSPMNPKET